MKIFKKKEKNTPPAQTAKPTKEVEQKVENPIFHDFTPSPKYGDQIASLPEKIRSFGVPISSLSALKLTSLSREYDSCISDIFYAPSYILTNPEGHTTRMINPQLACFAGYSQRAMTYRFLNTMKYYEIRGEISTEIFKEIQLVLYTNLLGNTVNLLVDFDALHFMLLNNNEKTLQGQLFGLMMIQRANLNWIYADYCSNLQKELPNAREMLIRCACVSSCKDSQNIHIARDMQPQFDYVFDKLFTNPERKSLYSNDVVDTGKYDFYKRTIEYDIRPACGEDVYYPEDYSK